MSLKILAIDPGLSNTGWSVLRVEKDEHFIVEDLGTFKTSSKKDFYERLALINESLLSVAKKYSIEFVTAEDIFFTRNVSSSIKVAKVIGSLAYSFYKELSLKIKLFTPTQIKCCISGLGTANKELVKKTVLELVDLSSKIATEHEADSIACAICMYYFLKSENNILKNEKNIQWNFQLK